jgi:hypothetical protein
MAHPLEQVQSILPAGWERGSPAGLIAVGCFEAEDVTRVGTGNAASVALNPLARACVEREQRRG